MTERPHLTWTDAGGPRAADFDDLYFSAEDGLAESRLVFLEGLGLPDGWNGRRGFTVGELGFGTGLNVLALLQLWRSTRPSPKARLNIVSVEAFPMTRDEAARALGAWPELADLAAPLLAAWPAGRRGVHRVAWPELGANLVLFIGDVADALDAWTGRADAWMLDGFAPSRNPAMWNEPVLAAVAAHSRPGARAATFTVAGVVRRGLEAAGFTLERRPGFGRKRERLQARLGGVAVERAPAPRSVAIVGAGIAGASLARAFAAQGVAVTVVERSQAGVGASGAPAALVTPRLDAGLGAPAILHAESFARAIQLYAESEDVILARGVLQLETGERDAARFDKLAGWDGFAPADLARLNAARAGAAIGEPSTQGALSLATALTVRPGRVLEAWLGEARRVVGDVAGLERDGEGWRLRDDEGGLIAAADIVVLAGGAAGAGLVPDLPLQPVRGQVELADGHRLSGSAAAWGGYAAPTDGGLLFGATHARGDAHDYPRGEDRARNLATLAQGLPDLASRLADAPLRSWASVRAATPDHLPLAGASPGKPGVFVLSGLGGRGFTLAPLLAEHVAALALDANSPLPRRAAEAVDPARFGTRRARARSPVAPLETPTP